MRRILILVVVLAIAALPLSALEQITHGGVRGYFVTEEELADVQLLWQAVQFYRYLFGEVFGFLGDRIGPALSNADLALSGLVARWQGFFGQ